MVRRKRLLVELALVGALGLLVFPGAGSALIEPFTVALTSTGPSPAVIDMPAGYPLVFNNTDTVTHAVAFANGLCSIDIAAGSHGQCSGNLGTYVGNYAYTVDGTTQAQLVVTAIPRSVSLKARRTTVHRGSLLTLSGRLQDVQYPSPPNAGASQPVIVIARPYPGHPFYRVAAVRATVHRSPGDPIGKLLWQIRVRPRSSTQYAAIASYEPAGGKVWERARSKLLRVTVRR